MLRPPEDPDVQCDSLAAIVRRRLSWLVVLLVTFVATPALADPGTEKAAQALQKKAIEEDNLNVNYAAAIKKLESATKKCGPDKCNPQLRASLFRDLGAMQILNGAADAGKGNFAQAISLDAAIELDPAYKTPDLEAAWADVKKNGAAAGGAPAAPVKAGPQPTEGDFTTTPPPEAQLRTPLPVYVEYGGSEDLTRVAIKYKGAGMSDWKSLDLPKLDQGFGALIPCKDVTQGLMLYFVQGFNDKNDPVATSGSKKQPFSVPVNAQLIGPAPSLPGQDPPAQCEDVVTGTECPPDFPGCAKKKAADEECAKDDECDSNSCSDGKCAGKKQNGEECAKDAECTSDQCSSGKCSGGKKAEGEDCEADEDCDSGRCKEEKCAAGGSSKGKGPKVWLGVSVSIDATILPAANDVCSRYNGHINSQGYACTDTGSGTAFPDGGSDLTNFQNLILGDGDQVVGGFKFPANIRFLATLDYALGKNSLLGLRAGYVLGTDPGKPAFAPLHLEARYTYLFGKDAVSKVGLAPMMLIGVGAGEFDAYVPVTANLSCTVGCTKADPVGSKESGQVNAWLTAGPIFVTAGGGLRYLATSRFALLAAIKFQAAFGGAAGFLPGFAPELGFQYGF
jgi:hypothetical protein